MFSPKKYYVEMSKSQTAFSGLSLHLAQLISALPKSKQI